MDIKNIITKKISSSILVKLGIAAFFLVAITNLVEMLWITHTVEESYNELLTKQLAQKNEVLSSEMNKTSAASLSFLQQLQNDTSFVALLNEANLEHIFKSVAEKSEFVGLRNIVVVDNDNNLLSSFATMNEEQKAEIVSLVDYVKLQTNEQYNGIAKIFSDGPCLMAVKSMRNSAGEIVATIVASKKSLADKEYLKTLSSMEQLPISTVVDNRYVASSLEDDEKYADVLETEYAGDAINDIIINTKTTYISEGEEYYGYTNFASYTPIFDYRDALVAVMVSGANNLEGESINDNVFQIFLIAGAVVAVVIITLALWLFNMILARPLRLLKESVGYISQGDLTQKVRIIKTRDEVQAIGEGIALMQVSLRDTLVSIMNSANVLNASSGELSRSSVTLSQGANTQAASLEEIASALEEMTTNIHNNSDNAQRTEHLVEKANEAVNTISQESTKSLNETLKIGKSIKEVNSLVNQTNILSLNAAVEAARAGSQGRGFAVVAKEVGRLAEETRKASVGISETATNTMDGSKRVNALIESIAPQMNNVTSLVREITAASKEEGIGVDQINASILNLNKITQESAASAEEISASAEELARTAEKMNELVCQFKV